MNAAGADRAPAVRVEPRLGDAKRRRGPREAAGLPPAGDRLSRLGVGARSPDLSRPTQIRLDSRSRLHSPRPLALSSVECQAPGRLGKTFKPSADGGNRRMKLKPLGDRLIVQAIEEEETTASGIVLPDTAKEKPQKGKVIAVGDGADRGRRAPPARRERGRRGPLQQVRRHRDQGRRRRPARPSRVGRPGQGRLATSKRLSRTYRQKEERRNGSQGAQVRRGGARRAAGRRRRRRQRGQGDARPEGSLRRPRQEVRRPDDHQRRRHDRPRDRDRGRVREPGRTAGARGRHGDQRRRRRRHHDGDPAGPDDRPLGPQERRRRRQPAGAPPRDREGGRPGGREPARQAVEGDRAARSRSPASPRSRPPTTRSATSSPTRSTRSARTAS